MPALTIMNFAKRNISALSDLYNIPSCCHSRLKLESVSQVKESTFAYDFLQREALSIFLRAKFENHLTRPCNKELKIYRKNSKSTTSITGAVQT